jgi:RNA polymerase sigma-70 factor, ECF subfamily
MERRRKHGDLCGGFVWPKEFCKQEVRPLHQENQQPQGSPGDAELIARAQQGDEGAFEALYHAHKRRVYRLCLRMVGNPAEAEELTQEAFLRLFRKIHTFRGESAFSTWLHRLTVNIVLMRLRKKTPNEISVETSEESEQSDRPPVEFGALDLELGGTLDRVSLETAVAKLPEGYRQVFVYYDVLGYEHHEIAAMMDCSVGNSKSQLHKARMRLRKLLGKMYRKTAGPRKTPGMARSVECSMDSPPGSDASAAPWPQSAAVLHGDS